jgi:hypothetical protein
MLNRLIAVIVAMLGSVSVSGAETRFKIDGVEVHAPTGWRQVKTAPDRIMLRSADNHQQATVSLLHFRGNPSFEDFKRLCDHRIDAEKKELGDGFIQPAEPFEKSGAFGMFFSGGDPKASRIFSGYLTLQKADLITVYVEGVGVAANEHLDSFRIFVAGLKRP